MRRIFTPALAALALAACSTGHVKRRTTIRPGR